VLVGVWGGGGGGGGGTTCRAGAVVTLGTTILVLIESSLNPLRYVTQLPQFDKTWL